MTGAAFESGQGRKLPALGALLLLFSVAGRALEVRLLGSALESASSMWAATASVMLTAAGAVGIPIAGALICAVHGYIQKKGCSRSQKAVLYCFALGAALALEPFYDLAVYASPFESEGQSPLISIFLAACMLGLAGGREGRSVFRAVAVFACAALWTLMLSSQWGAVTAVVAIRTALSKKERLIPYAETLFLCSLSVFSFQYILAPLGSALMLMWERDR